MSTPALCVVIPRLVRKSERERSPDADAGHVAISDAVLFLPLDPANPGRIVCWSAIDGHSEASLDYYRSTVPARDVAEVDAAAALVRRYRCFMRSIPAEFRQPLVIRQRRPAHA